MLFGIRFGPTGFEESVLEELIHLIENKAVNILLVVLILTGYEGVVVVMVIH